MLNYLVNTRNWKWLFLLLVVISLNSQILLAQVWGCTDPQGTNFNPDATKNDGSCIYSIVRYFPTQSVTLPNTLVELSGMVYWRGVFWGHNDGGNGPWLYAIDTATGTIQKTIGFEGIANIDWEDIAQDSANFYIGDFGNNATGSRTDLKIIIISKTSILASEDSVILKEDQYNIINFRYPDQADFTPTEANKTSFDCEAMFYHRGKLHLITKNWTGDYSVHYSLPIVPGTYFAERHDSLKTDEFLITGADIGAEDQIIMTAYNENGSCRMVLVYGFDFCNNYFETGNKRWIHLPSSLSIGQLEAICFINGISGAMGSERFAFSNFDIPQNFSRFKTSFWVIDHYKKQSHTLAIEGMLRFNNETDSFEYFNGFEWIQLPTN